MMWFVASGIQLRGHGTHRARLAAMKPSGYAAQSGRNGKKVEWSSRFDPSNSEARYTSGGNGFSTEGRGGQLVLALQTCESLSSLSDQNSLWKDVCRRRRLRQEAIFITLVTNTIPLAAHFAPYLLTPRAVSALICVAFRECALTKVLPAQADPYINEEKECCHRH
jgi:hypothetical protein